MSQNIPIHDLTTQTGLTSRTLRYWEQKGLIKSIRDPQSTWRAYDDEAIRKINLVALLRELDIPIKDVKKIIDSKELGVAAKIFQMQIEKLESENADTAKRIELLYRCLSSINSMGSLESEVQWIDNMEKTLAVQISSEQVLKCEWEENIMTNSNASTGSLRIISLPAMRLAVCNVICESPEEEALNKILQWTEQEKLMGTARIFMYNTTPYSPVTKEYGMAAGVSVPEAVKIPDCFQEKRVPGGLYAAFNSTNEVYDSWQLLMKQLKENEDYIADESRQCLEEHIASGESKGDGNDFYLTLLEPVRRK